MDLSLDDRPPALRRFCELLRSRPLCAVARPGLIGLYAVRRTADTPPRLILDVGWMQKNWPDYCEAADLFWGDAGVWEWVQGHPCAWPGVHYQNAEADVLGGGCGDLEWDDNNKNREDDAL